MLQLIKLIWDICVLRAPPQRLPRSVFLEGSTLFVYATVGSAVLWVERPLGNAIAGALFDAFLLVTLTQVALWVRDLPERRTQTVTALAGTGTVISLIALPLFLTAQGASGLAATVETVVWLALSIWNVVIMGHILRHALSVPFPASIGVALVYVYISFKVINILFIQTV